MTFESELSAWKQDLEEAATEVRGGAELSAAAREALAKMLESLALESSAYDVPEGTAELVRELVK